MRDPLEIIWEHGAARKHDALPSHYREQVEAALDRFALTGHGDVVPYKAARGVYRLRTGSYRVFFSRSGQAIVGCGR